tara:strand:- start:1323 stop:2507 length:1185 start_codon:yes stop_codon:yes gene_type:complete
MPDLLDANGLQTKDVNELISDLTLAMQNIFGADINVDPNSPDGQLINIFSQSAVDVRELLEDVYNNFDPDRASGRVLDERVVINNIVRKAGTYTIQPIEITNTSTVSLTGLDGDFNEPDGVGYTVQDDAGTEFVLIDSVVLVAGVNTVNFRARNIGLVETTVNTITNAVTIVLGVTGIDNTSGSLQTGENEETDAQLRVRRSSSVANASNGYLNGLLGTILNLDGVTEAKLYENVTNSIDADGIEAHGIWLIVEGGANTEIADEIYAKKSYGANMTGAVEIPITTSSGAIFTAKFDRPTPENLYIRFDIQTTVSGSTFDQTTIKQCIIDNLSYTISEYAETSKITGIAMSCITGGVPVNVEISTDDITYVDYIETTGKDNQFTVDVSRITITEL